MTNCIGLAVVCDTPLFRQDGTVGEEHTQSLSYMVWAGVPEVSGCIRAYCYGVYPHSQSKSFGRVYPFSRDGLRFLFMLIT